jgi:hypothetical protein
MRRDENWAIDISRIRAFFREQTDVYEENGNFCFGNCSIILIPQIGSAMDKWVLPRTRIIFEGEDDAVAAIHRRFFLRFLSAGG